MLKAQRLKLQKNYTADLKVLTLILWTFFLPENKENTPAINIGAVFTFKEKALNCAKSNEVAFT